MTPQRILVVNADDFGRSAGVNRGVIEAHERGIVTSASLMVRYPPAAGAAEYARGRPQLGVGLHVDLGEWAYEDGEWHAVYELDDTGAEVQRQLERFRDLLDADPTHLDSHQHAHRDEPGRSVLRALAGELGVPLRHVTPGVSYCGGFYGQTDEGEALPENISVEALSELLRGLSPGATELCCHPASTIDFETAYGEPRLLELEALCAPSLRALIDAEGIELRSFRDVVLSTGSTSR
ncbi:MAG TPA: ChbG/HpnK family deacetylase [Gaiellaceae bacterium]|nr:ChbG/HpnK family deacetylase [Gaiellaceae bacterium]